MGTFRPAGVFRGLGWGLGWDLGWGLGFVFIGGCTFSQSDLSGLLPVDARADVCGALGLQAVTDDAAAAADLRSVHVLCMRPHVPCSCKGIADARNVQNAPRGPLQMEPRAKGVMCDGLGS